MPRPSSAPPHRTSPSRPRSSADPLQVLDDDAGLPDHLITIFVEHCTVARDSFSLRGKPEAYVHSTDSILDCLRGLLTQRAAQAKLNIHVNGETTQEDCPPPAGQPKVWQRHEAPLSTVGARLPRSISTSLPQAHRRAPSLTSSRSADDFATFKPRLGALEVVMEVTDEAKTESVTFSFPALRA